MDFDKIKPAVEEITLTDLQRQKILSACKDKKKKFNYKPLVAVAAAFVIVVIMAAPGFLIKAGMSTKEDGMVNTFADMEAAEDYFEYNAEAGVNTSQSLTAENPIFKAESFRHEYTVIPNEFASLVSEVEFTEWRMYVTAENGMAMMQFIEYFGISREKFDTANGEYIKRTGRDCFIGDIVYTFDREIIDEYYKE